jgi:excisionase family DNA binding protein
MISQTVTGAAMPSDRDMRIAESSSDALAPLLRKNGASTASIRFCTEGAREADIELPLPAVHLLLQALKEMAKGHSVTLLPVETELTTQQVAELLRMSRPSIIKMLDDGKLPYRKVGAHRRVRLDDALTYLKTERALRARVMEELMAETERLGLY